MDIGHSLKPINGFVVRWRQAGDMESLVEIDAHSGESMWDKEDFYAVFREQNIGCFVVTKIGKIVGFIIYETGRNSYIVLNAAVHPDYRRRGVGKILFDKLKSKIDSSHRSIRFDVRETNLTGHLFLRSNNFRAEKILYSYFMDYYTGKDDEEPEIEDAYLFYYRAKSKKKVKEEICISC